MIHTGGWNAADDDIGDVTIARIIAALEASRSVPREKNFFLVTAGSRAPVGGLAICELVRDYLVAHGVPEDSVLLPKHPRADNSIAEVLEAIALIKERRLRPQTFYVCSSWRHINPRLRVIWRKYGEGLKPRFVSAKANPHAGALWGWSREILGTVLTLLGKTGPRYV